MVLLKMARKVMAIFVDSDAIGNMGGLIGDARGLY